MRNVFKKKPSIRDSNPNPFNICSGWEIDFSFGGVFSVGVCVLWWFIDLVNGIGYGFCVDSVGFTSSNGD